MSIIDPNSWNPKTSIDSYYDSITGKTLIGDSNWPFPPPASPTPEELAAMDEYNRNKELKEVEHQEKLKALKTLFPRGHAPIDNFDIMVDIARQDQLNPLYEKVLKEFEDAQTALHRAANKLASAVKLTDSDEIEGRIEQANKNSWTNTFAGVSTRYTYNPSTLYTTLGGNSALGSTTISPPNITGPAGPMGPMGVMGPKGEVGDTGPQGPKGDRGASYWEGIRDWFKGLMK